MLDRMKGPVLKNRDEIAIMDRANRVVLEMLSGIAFRRRGGTWSSIPATLLEDRL